jgi:hypothetical protein
MLVFRPFDDTTFAPDEHAQLMAIKKKYWQALFMGEKQLADHYICPFSETGVNHFNNVCPPKYPKITLNCRR